MGIVYGILTTVISSIPIFLIFMFRKSVILKVPILKKNYTYEYLKEKYSYYKRKYTIILVANILFFFIVFYMLYNVANRFYNINEQEYIVLVSSKYWAIPAAMYSVLSSYMVTRIIMERILGEDFTEFLILLYVECGCYNMTDIIKEIYHNNRKFKVWGNIIAIIMIVYSICGFNAYVKIEKDEIIISNYGEFNIHKYAYDDIETIRETYINNYNKNGLGHNFIVSFKDGYEWRSKDRLISVSSKEDNEMMAVIEARSGIKAKEC